MAAGLSPYTPAGQAAQAPPYRAALPLALHEPGAQGASTAVSAQALPSARARAVAAVVALTRMAVKPEGMRLPWRSVPPGAQKRPAAGVQGPLHACVCSPPTPYVPGLQGLQPPVARVGKLPGGQAYWEAVGERVRVAAREAEAAVEAEGWAEAGMVWVSAGEALALAVVEREAEGEREGVSVPLALALAAGEREAASEAEAAGEALALAVVEREGEGEGGGLSVALALALARSVAEGAGDCEAARGGEGEAAAVREAGAEALAAVEGLGCAVRRGEGEKEATAVRVAVGEKTRGGAPAEGRGKASAEAAASDTGSATVTCTCARKALAFTPEGRRQGSRATSTVMLTRLEELARARLASAAAAPARPAGTVMLTFTKLSATLRCTEKSQDS